LRCLRARNGVDFDQCAFGESSSGASRRPTRLATNKRAMCLLSRKCTAEHDHVPVRKVDEHPVDLARGISILLAAPDNSDGLDELLPVDNGWDMEPDVGPAIKAQPDAEPNVIDDKLWTGPGGSCSRGRQMLATRNTCAPLEIRPCRCRPAETINIGFMDIRPAARASL